MERKFTIFEKENVSMSVESNLRDEVISELDELEKGGNRFVKVKKVDEKSRRRSAGIAAAVMILLMVFVEVLFISVLMSDPEVPLPAAIFLTGIPVIVTVGILLALRERMREIKEGEYDEALKY